MKNSAAGPATDHHIARNEAQASVQYAGLARISRESLDGVLRLLQYGDRVTHARILSCSRKHCLLLTINVGDVVAVKSGFSSGYIGEGPRALSYVLQVLEAHGVEIEECAVSDELIRRLDSSSLTEADLVSLDTSKAISPARWRDYILEPPLEADPRGLWYEFPAVIPFAVIDPRISDLAISFWQAPDERLLTGYRRLEDIVRRRTGSEEHGVKLLNLAFAPSRGKLTWSEIGDGELAGRMNLFTGAYMAYRNRRAHRESMGRTEEVLTEFLLLNHLYRLEREAIEREIM